MIKVLVTGKDSQLARCIGDVKKNYPNISFTFKNSKDLDITDSKSVKTNFENNDFNYCINCAAYTAVDNAETEIDNAKNINTVGVLNLANACKENSVSLIHISTDFVFDGKSDRPYLTTDKVNPISVYGETKSNAEKEIKSILEAYFIIRTSWLYSQYNNNFLKTMLSLSESRKEISVVNDQIGCPTSAKNLASFVCDLINTNSQDYGLYNYCNKGETSWYNFAEQIFEMWNKEINLIPIPTSEYPTPAKRPKYSVLDVTKTEKIFNIKINNWKEALIQFYLTQNKK